MTKPEEKPQEQARILVVTPSHNEEAYLPRTIASMEAQVVKPALWILVDDGSSDATGRIADMAASRNPGWIRSLHRPPRTDRSVGPGVVDAFYAGLEQVNLEDFDYLCKLDGDLEFSPRLFEKLLEKGRENPRLGTWSGKIWEKDLSGKVRLYRTNPQFSVGCCKFYRTQVFLEIGGFVRQVMWDGIDCHKCRMLGWEARSFHDEDLRLLHLRPMGSSKGNIFLGRRRWGRGQYFMGTHPLYLLGIVFYRLWEPPYILGGLNILFGYLHAWITGAEQYDDKEFRRFLRRWQMERLGLAFLAGGRRDRGG